MATQIITLTLTTQGIDGGIWTVPSVPSNTTLTIYAVGAGIDGDSFSQGDGGCSGAIAKGTKVVNTGQTYDYKISDVFFAAEDPNNYHTAFGWDGGTVNSGILEAPSASFSGDGGAVPGFAADCTNTAGSPHNYDGGYGGSKAASAGTFGSGGGGGAGNDSTPTGINGSNGSGNSGGNGGNNGGSIGTNYYASVGGDGATVTAGVAHNGSPATGYGGGGGGSGQLLSFVTGTGGAGQPGAIVIFYDDGTSGTTYTKSYTGTITPSATYAKQARKSLTGTITPSASLAKLVAKALTGTITPSGAYSSIKLVVNIFAGTITLSGSLVKQAGKGLTGTITPSATLVKDLAKSLVGTITLSASYANGWLLYKAYTGTITLSGALAKQAQKAVTGTVSLSGALAKMAGKGLTGTITPSGAYSRFTSTLATVLRFTVNLVNYDLVKCNRRATVAPNVNDCAGTGYAIGSTIIHGNDVYVCTDATNGAAVWKLVTVT